MNVNLNVHVNVPESLVEKAKQACGIDNTHHALELFVSGRVQSILDAEAADAVQPRATKGSKKKR